MSFDPQFARDTVLPLVQAAYQVFHNPDVDPTLPAGYQKTALLEADPTLLDLITRTFAKRPLIRSNGRRRHHGVRLGR